VQLIDVRDLAAWMVLMTERGGTGVFNATSPAEAHTWEAMTAACGVEMQDCRWLSAVESAGHRMPTSS